MKKAECSVTYVDHMGSDLSVVNAARQSFDKQKTEYEPAKDDGLISYLATGKRTKEWDSFLDEITELSYLACASDDESETKNARENLKQRLIAYKREAQHFAPFAHPHVTIRLRMPIFLARQFVKHQVGGVWSEESRRYISDEPEFYFEPVLMARPDDIKQGAAGEVSNSNQAMMLMENATSEAMRTYKLLVDEFKMAPEQAREVLTLNMMTGVTWTGSLLFWSRVVNQRVDSHAQAAAQLLAKKISDILQPLYPVSWKALTGI